RPCAAPGAGPAGRGMTSAGSRASGGPAGDRMVSAGRGPPCLEPPCLEPPGLEPLGFGAGPGGDRVASAGSWAVGVGVLVWGPVLAPPGPGAGLAGDRVASAGSWAEGGLRRWHGGRPRQIRVPDMARRRMASAGL